MKASEDPELIDFLGKKFDAIDARFDRVDARLDKVETGLTRVEVLQEEQGGTLKLLSEGQRTLEDRMERGFADVRAELATHREVVEAAFHEHEKRIAALEARSTAEVKRGRKP